jgi:hypothetical protein
VNSTSDSMTFTTAENSRALRYFISFQWLAFLGDNIITMVPWILLISITFLGWVCCATVHLLRVCRKEKLILSPSEKKKAAEAKKAEADAIEHDDDPEEEDEDEDVDVLVEEDIRPSNNHEFRGIISAHLRKRVQDLLHCTDGAILSDDCYCRLHLAPTFIGSSWITDLVQPNLHEELLPLYRISLCAEIWDNIPAEL